MKSVLLSIKPKWCAKIMNGEMTIVVRKNTPKCDLPIDVYIYCTKDDDLGRINDYPNKYFVDCVETPQDFKKMDSAYNGKGKIVAKFRCYKVEEITPQMWTPKIEHDILEKSCLKEHELFDYICSHDGTEDRPFYAIHISDLEIFDKPKELSEFKKNNSTGNCWKCKLFGSGCSTCQLTKAPQNYCYIEVEK